MKNRNIAFTALVALAFALAPILQAAPYPDGGPTYLSSSGSTDEQGQLITIHSTGKVQRGKIGSFVLTMNRATTGAAGASPATEAIMGGMYVNFKVSGTAVAGVDYLPLVSPAYIGASGYAVILVHTLPNARASASLQSYSVVVTLEPGPGYALGTARSAQLMIVP